MRASLILGVILVLLGGYILVRGTAILTTHDVVKLGDLHVTDTDSHPVPPWVGGAIAVAGAVLIVAGARKRS